MDYRSLNVFTKADIMFPMTLMDEATDGLEGNVFFSHLDCNSAYWQIPVAKEDREKTSFRTRFCLCEFFKMPFGLSGSPATHSRGTLRAIVEDRTIVPRRCLGAWERCFHTFGQSRDGTGQVSDLWFQAENKELFLLEMED